jgi:hypothetical protein
MLVAAIVAAVARGRWPKEPTPDLASPPCQARSKFPDANKLFLVDQAVGVERPAEAASRS